ncbi:MAG: hypothetical protein FWD64_11875 [Acidobacteriaceae bacterium]|nr:hypothetical protein [Acidobacteriaceae bacterium]
MSANWKEVLTAAVRDTKASFESIELVGNEAHAQVVIALLRAFGDDPTTMMFAESRTPDHAIEKNARPADVLVLHPVLGAFFVEVKGWVIRDIVRIDAGTIFREVKGDVQPFNPWQQAQDAAGQLKNATSKVVNARKLSAREVPHFDWIVALPNISQANWTDREYDESLNNCEVLFSEELSDPVRLRDKLTEYIARKAGYRLPFSRDQLNHVREALGSSEIIRSRKNRTVLGKPERIGARIASLEVTGKRLSEEQMDIIRSEFDGRPQLIRGVAGSGKSIVLIKNLAHLIDRTVNTAQLSFGTPPAKRFLVVCFNHALIPYLRNLFDMSYRELTLQNEPPSCVDMYILNQMLYKHSDKYHEHPGPLKYQNVQQGMNREIALNYCAQIDRLAQTAPQILEDIQYDTIYVDEGQDLFDEEFVLLLKFLKTDPSTGLKNIVIFYDDAQNLYGRPRPTWGRLGIEVTGRTRVMKKCFRNTKQIVEFAFNLLLGKKAETTVKTRGFADVETLKENGLVRELSDRWEVNFAERIGDTPTVTLFGTREKEKEWIEANVLRLITDEGVRPEDILLVSAYAKTYESVADHLKERCESIKRVIKPYGEIKNNPDKDRYIFENGCLTLATVKAAKGYDSPIVFLMGVDSFTESVEDRAQFYVGATRAKVCLFVTGIRGQGLAEEAEAVSKLLATSTPNPDAPPVVQIEPNRHLARPRPSKPSIPARPVRQDVQVPTRPAAPVPSVLQAFTPKFRRGASVQHPRYGVGRVVQDGYRKYLSSQDRWDEDVRVQFGGTIKKLEAESDGLVLVEEGKAL